MMCEGMRSRLTASLAVPVRLTKMLKSYLRMISYILCQFFHLSNPSRYISMLGELFFILQSSTFAILGFLLQTTLDVAFSLTYCNLFVMHLCHVRRCVWKLGSVQNVL